MVPLFFSYFSLFRLFHVRIWFYSLHYLYYSVVLCLLYNDSIKFAGFSYIYLSLNYTRLNIYLQTARKSLAATVMAYPSYFFKRSSAPSHAWIMQAARKSPAATLPLTYLSKKLIFALSVISLSWSLSSLSWRQCVGWTLFLNWSYAPHSLLYIPSSVLDPHLNIINFIYSARPALICNSLINQ